MPQMRRGVTKMDHRKVTVFGGSGFLGSHVSQKLTEAGYEVLIYDVFPSPYLLPAQQMVVGDTLDEAAVQKAVAGADFVFNFAGIADIEQASLRPLDTIRQNIMGNGIVLEACRKENVKRYVFASSSYVYSKSGAFYRCSKQACELYIETYQEQFGLDYTMLRYGSLYGPRSDERNAIYRFVQQALTERVLHYEGSPDAMREYIHVEDAARCSVEILGPEYANQHVILTGHHPMRVRDLFRMIAEMLPFEVEMRFEEKYNPYHYLVTPYSFNPRMGRKLAPSYYVDIGQGILRLLDEQYTRMQHPDKPV